MHRRSKNKNARLEDKENQSGFSEEWDEASFPDLLKDQKICKVTKSKEVEASKNKNLNDGNPIQVQKCSLNCNKGFEEESYHKEEDAAICFDALKGGVVGEPPFPLNSKENLSRSRPVPPGDECYLTPPRDRAEEKSYGGISEKRREKPVDFAALTVTEFGITQESLTKGSIGKSPTLLKFRRRSTIGLRGSPENNALIQYIAQQRSKMQKEAYTQVSPFKQKTVRSLKDKIDAFQMSFTSVQEAEGEIGSSGPSQVEEGSPETGYSQNKVLITKEQNLELRSDKFISDSSGADLKENFNQTSNFTSDCITKDVGSTVVSDLRKKRVSFVEEVSLEIFDESKPPITPVQTRNNSLNEHTQSGSRLRSVLKKTPLKQLMDSMKEYSNDSIDGGGGECLPASSCAGVLETLQTEKTGSYSSEKPKKRVTFGEVLSPEIFDQTLPASTPLHKGATPVRQPSLQNNSPFARPSLVDEPLSQPNFDCDDECAEPLEEMVEDSLAVDDFLPVANAEADTDKADTFLSAEEQGVSCNINSEGTDCSISKATDTKDAEEAKNPRKNRSQRQKNITTSAAKKTQKAKRATYGKRRKKKVKKSLYGEREMASKKPLLSPIPEIPEVFSSASSPCSPKANAFFTGNIKSGNAHKDVRQKSIVKRKRGKSVDAVPVCSGSKDLDAPEAGSSDDVAFQVSDDDLKSLSGVDHKLSDVPDAKCVLGTPEYFQQGKEAACAKEAEENGFLMENEKLQGQLPPKAEQLSRLEFLEQQDTSVPEGAQGTRCPQEDSVRGSLTRKRRSSSAIYFPPVEKLGIIGSNLSASPFNIEEVLSAPRLQNDSLEPRRRKSDNSGDRRVRRSMRLHKDAEAEGLAWIQIPSEIQKNPPLLASSGKMRRTISTSILRESENVHHLEQNLIQFSAPGKENNNSFDLADRPCKRWRRKTICLSAPQETRTSSQTWRRSMTNSVYKKDRNNKKNSEEVEIPLESNSNV
ncbi:cell division cycle-associated protein 2 isoform X2 [Cuculus canorus]|uniref:cell division cycle-associated protein 2 isoform X2 n=1 Tax=Cuculus canorus TaxID=55661 RepID=UPI0023AAA0D0|nr:cell division cycle-associated protein 2 isoform X2 [Cuculus canorus]